MLEKVQITRNNLKRLKGMEVEFGEIYLTEQEIRGTTSGFYKR